jgi:hypothetical protein
MNIIEPNRKKHGYTQKLNAPPEKIFPLLCPVMEVEWAPGWMPEVVLSESGFCEQECIFITPAEMSSEPENAIWLVSKYDPGKWELEMYKVSPQHTISKLEISLTAQPDNRTKAYITYETTSIGPAGDTFMEEFTEDWYEGFMVEWENAMNYYLNTGEKIA